MIVLAHGASLPLYQQLYQYLREEILSGKRSGGTKLPSSRHLAEDLAISRNTVTTAYQQLLAEGYISGRERSGYYIEHLPDIPFPNEKKEKITKTSFGETDETVNEKAIIRYNFMYGSFCEQDFPFRRWQQIFNQCIRDNRLDSLSYQDFHGNYGLRQEISRYLHTYRDIDCQPKQIIVAAGTWQCLFIAGQLIAKKTKRIAVENPGYKSACDAFLQMGFSLDPIPVSHHGLKVKFLAKSLAKAVYVTPSHQFPTGAVLSATRRLQLIGWARNTDGWIIEDDHSSHLRYDVKPIPALQRFAPERVFYVGNFSKTLLPSLRAAYLVLPLPMLESAEKMFSHMPSSVSFFSQKSLEIFMHDGFFSTHLRRQQQKLKRKQTKLLTALKKFFGSDITVLNHGAGVHFMVRLHGGVSAAKFAAEAAKQGIALADSTCFCNFYEYENDDCILLGFSGIEEKDILPGVQCLRDIWENLR